MCIPLSAGVRVCPGSMAAPLRGALSRLGALKRFAVSRHSFGAGLLHSARTYPDPRSAPLMERHIADRVIHNKMFAESFNQQ
jgi:hypothetical protein